MFICSNGNMNAALVTRFQNASHPHMSHLHSNPLGVGTGWTSLIQNLKRPQTQNFWNTDNVFIKFWFFWSISDLGFFRLGCSTGQVCANMLKSRKLRNEKHFILDKGHSDYCCLWNLPRVAWPDPGRCALQAQPTCLSLVSSPSLLCIAKTNVFFLCPAFFFFLNWRIY